MASMFDRARAITAKEILAGAAVIIAVALLVVYKASDSRMGNTEMRNATGEVIEIPPYTEEVAAQLAASTGFQHLISYTASGFEPMSVTIQQGETIRFTNNSSGDMWIAADGTDESPVYPGPGSCGQSALDTCRSLAPLEFWEFTFDRAGTWQVTNNLNKADTASITVTAQ